MSVNIDGPDGGASELPAARINGWRRFGPAGFSARARAREQAAYDRDRVNDVKWMWRLACEHTGLGVLMFTPSGQTVSVPLVGRVELGPPTTMTVRLRPGQTRKDLVAAAGRLALAMKVARIEITSLATGWVLVELVTATPRPYLASVPMPSTVHYPAPPAAMAA